MEKSFELQLKNQYSVNVYLDVPYACVEGMNKAEDGSVFSLEDVQERLDISLTFSNAKNQYLFSVCESYWGMIDNCYANNEDVMHLIKDTGINNKEDFEMFVRAQIHASKEFVQAVDELAKECDEYIQQQGRWYQAHQEEKAWQEMQSYPEFNKFIPSK